MEREYKLSMGLIELEDMLDFYLLNKCDYPANVKKVLKKLVDAIEDSTYPSKEIARKYDIVDIDRTYVEETITGKKYETKDNIDCMMLYNFVVNYFSNKGMYFYPKEIIDTVDKLKNQLSKYLLDSGKEDLEDFYIIDKVEYEEVYNGSKDK